MSSATQAELNEFVNNVFTGFTPAEEEFMVDEMARAIANNVEHTTYEAERGVLGERYDVDFEERNQLTDVEPGELESAAEDIESGKSPSETVEEHFSMNFSVASAAFITIFIGLWFIITGEGNPNMVQEIFSSAPTYAVALTELKKQV